VNFPKLFYRDVINNQAPVRFMSNVNSAPIAANAYLPANWGPGGTNVAPPESIVTQSFYTYGFVGQAARGAFKFKSLTFLDPPPTTDAAWMADTTVAEPDWSSDGNYICFSRRVPGETQRDIWLLATNATSFSQATQVTQGPADDSHPRFSKDGQTIFFISNRQDRYGLNGIFATERRGTNLWAVRRYDLP
jgi:dipeptidyl aminopeptidase/acylaminoacyl peptidase